jgi:DNA-binding XRE family transcriptional regulator
MEVITFFPKGLKTKRPRQIGKLPSNDWQLSERLNGLLIALSHVRYSLGVRAHSVKGVAAAADNEKVEKRTRDAQRSAKIVRNRWCTNRRCCLVYFVFWLYNGSVYRRFTKVDGERLRQLRRERALSQRDLSEITGIAHDSISQLETGKRDAQPRTIRKLAGALGVKPHELMKGEVDG